MGTGLSIVGGGLGDGFGGELLELLEGGVGAVLQGIYSLLLELGDLVKLDIEDFVAEALLVIGSPRLLGIVIGRAVLAEQALELGVVDVLILPFRIDGLAQSPTEAHGRWGCVSLLLGIGNWQSAIGARCEVMKGVGEVVLLLWLRRRITRSD